MKGVGWVEPVAPEASAAPQAALPDKSRQALRLKRYLIGAGTSLLAAAALFIGYWLGLLPLNIAVGGAALIGFFVVLFYGLFRSELNLRFRDPSLTAQMILAAVLTLAYLMYHAPAARGTLSLFYLVALLFGVLRLETTRLLVLALVAFLAHATVLALSGSLGGPAAADSWLQLAILAIVLPWFAAMGGYVNKLRRRLSDSNRQLKEAVDRAEEIAMRDVLTGAYNRRHLMDVLRREISRAQRIGAPLAVCLMDIDHFKRVNDNWGHAAGDAVLRHFANVATTGLRAVDVFGRFGGEEFLLILPDTDARGAAAVAERIRAAVEQGTFPGIPVGHQLTVTIGVAGRARDEGGDALTARADLALYRGKEAGRNRVVVS
ncbi:MAG TPA: GGDEF domain-containing protein [Burkholderiales bacterium]|jgi:diguanylate cyclase (GGDEF)-like protein|nr:GGDEF domain-containing protein [Burkholderiales bacterium]